MSKVTESISQYKNLTSILSPTSMLLIIFTKLPYTMISIGILIAVRYTTNSIIVAGFSTACLSLSSAFSSLIISKYCDIYGSRKIASFILPITLLSLSCLILVLYNSYPNYIIYINCIIIGASIIPIGSITRSIWIKNSTDHKNIQLALSYESSADELLYVLGPALVGIISSIFGEFVLLTTITTLILVFNTIFVVTLLKKTTTSHHLEENSKNKVSIFDTVKAVYLPMLSIVSIGIFFGAVQVSITEIATDYGSGYYAGLSYATIGISSSIAAILMVVLPVNFKLWDRQIVFSILLFIATAPCVFISSLPWATFFMLVLGTFVGPCIVTIFSICEMMSKTVSVQIAMAGIGASMIVGNAIGSSIAGPVAAMYNGNISVIVALVACILCSIFAVVIKIKITKHPIKSNI